MVNRIPSSPLSPQPKLRPVHLCRYTAGALSSHLNPLSDSSTQFQSHPLQGDRNVHHCGCTITFFVPVDCLSSLSVLVSSVSQATSPQPRCNCFFESNAGASNHQRISLRTSSGRCRRR